MTKGSIEPSRSGESGVDLMAMVKKKESPENKNKKEIENRVPCLFCSANFKFSYS